MNKITMGLRSILFLNKNRLNCVSILENFSKSGKLYMNHCFLSNYLIYVCKNKMQTKKERRPAMKSQA